MSKMELCQDSDSFEASIDLLIHASNPVLSLKRLGTFSELSTRVCTVYTIHATQREESIRERQERFWCFKN
jgi:hypothetical protein